MHGTVSIRMQVWEPELIAVQLRACYRHMFFRIVFNAIPPLRSDWS